MGWGKLWEFFRQTATPSTPPSGYDKLYFKSDDKLYKKTSAGVESEIPSSGGSATFSTVTATTANVTTLDTNVTTAKVTLSGTTLAAGGTDSNVDINITPKGTGEVNITKADIDAGTIDGAVLGVTKTNIQKGPPIVTTFAGTVTAAASTTVTFSSAADAILAGYDATNPILGTTLISNALTRYIVSWTNATTCVVDSNVTWAGTAITSVQLPISFEATSAGVLKRATLADGTEYLAGNVGIGTTTPSDILHILAPTGKGLTFDRTGTTDNHVTDIDFKYDTTNWVGKIRAEKLIGGGGNLLFYTSLNAYEPTIARVIIAREGNVGIGTTTFGTSAAKVLAMGSGTAPSTSPADAVQMWSQNNTGQGASGLAQLYIRDEYGISGPVMHALDQRDCENIIEDLSYYPPVTFTWDPGSLADGVGETSAAISVPGVSLGGAAVQCIAPYDLQGVTLNAYVDAADSCKARLQNETTGTIDLASGTWIMQARRI